MIYFLLVILVIFLIFDFIKNKKIFSPGFLFNGIFFVTLFLYNFYLSYLQQELSDKTIFILLLCVFAFNIPVFISYYITPKAKKETKLKLVYFELPLKVETFICSMVLIYIFAEMIYCGGFPLIWKLTGNSKVYVDFGVPSFNGFIYGVIVLMGAYSLFKKGNTYKYIYLIIGLLVISRQIIISIIIEGFILYLISSSSCKKSKKFYIGVVVLAIVGVLGFSIIGNIRTGASSFLTVAEFKEEYDWIPTSFKWIYSYLCFSLSNLNNLFSMTNGFVNFGASTLSQLLPNIFNFNLTINYSESFLVSDSFTVSTFAPDLYLDFGVLGVVLFSFIIGVLTCLVYKKVEQKSFVWSLIYMVLAHNIIFIFFINMYFYLPIIVQVVIIPIIFCNNKTNDLKLQYYSRYTFQKSPQYKNE